jgi:hypothetical protein
LLLLFLLAASVGLSQTNKATLSLSIRPLELPASPGSGEPNLYVSPDNIVYVSWVEPAGEGQSTLRFASSQPGASKWSAPRTIAEGKNWFVNWADFPSLTVGKNGHLMAHWLARTGQEPYAYSVYVSQSSDGGKTWSPARVLHDDSTPTEHGFVSLVPMEKSGETLAVWLDGRKTAGHSGHGGEMTLRSRMVRPDGPLGPEMLIDERVCDCCQTSAVALPGGRALVAY